MAFVSADDEATFQREVIEADRPVLVDFWAPWCGPCRAVAPELDALAVTYGDSLKVVKVNVDENPAAAARFGVRGIPTLGLFEAGALTNQIVGARPRHAIEADLGLGRFRAAVR